MFKETILDYVIEYQEHGGDGPTLSEIKAEIGVNPAQVQQDVNDMITDKDLHGYFDLKRQRRYVVAKEFYK